MEKDTKYITLDIGLGEVQCQRVDFFCLLSFSTQKDMP